MVGGYDLTVLPNELLEQALEAEGPLVPLRIPGQSVTHTLSRSSVETVLQAKRSRMQFAGV